MPVLPLSAAGARLLRELRARHARADVDRALASLRVRAEDAAAVISREEATSSVALFGANPPRGATVRIEPGVYAATPTAAARVRLLEAARAIAPRALVHAPLALEGTRTGRLLFDPPRRLAARLGERWPEPGDRFGGAADAFVHAFFDDEALVTEGARAGLRFAARRGGWILLEAGTPTPESAAPFTAELRRVLGVVRTVERARMQEPAAEAVARMRARGAVRGARGTVGRARLRRAIGWVDAAFPGGPNCLRRALAELALDAGAAEETLVFGLDVDRTGHVAFKDAEERTFDVAFELPP